MKKVKCENIIIVPEVRKFFSQIGKLGGASTSEKKASAVRKNGLKPCAPGKFRGRPPQVKK